MATKTAAVKTPDCTLAECLEVGALTLSECLGGMCAESRKNSTESYGWNGLGKGVITRKGSTPIRVQVDIKLTVIYSKPGSEKQPDCTVDECLALSHVELGEVLTNIAAEPRAFSTGSYGWYANGKASVRLSDKRLVRVQVGANLTIINSKPVKA